MVKEELVNVLEGSNIISFDTYNPDGSHRSNHNMSVSRVEQYEDCITVYGLGNESETLKGTINYEEDIDGYSITDELGIVTYVAAA